MTRTSLLLFALLAGCGSDDSADIATSTPVDDPVQNVSGSLAAGDETLGSGEYVDTYTMDAEDGNFILVDVTTDDFDPYIMVVSPSGEQTDVDDSAGSDLSSTEATVMVDEPGEWKVMVTSYSSGETGDYDLTYSVD